MKPQAKRAGRPPQDAARRLERAHRILDAAADLVLRWGYDKTTIEDVARRAEVAKGTIYLHWRTREELFAALLRRERVEMLSQVRLRVGEGPGTLRDLLRLLAFELMSRPLMKASLLGDSEMLGRLTREKRSSKAAAEVPAGFETYLGVLLKHGGLRTDLSPTEHVTALSSVLYGFLLVPQMMPEAYRLPDERLAELLADAGSRAVEPRGPVPAESTHPASARSAHPTPADTIHPTSTSSAHPTPADGTYPISADSARAISRATLEFVDFALETAQRKLRASLGSQGAPKEDET